MSWHQDQENGPNAIVFTPREVRQILAAYSEGVLKKNWRDYGFQSEAHATSFIVIERGQGDHNAILCALRKERPIKSHLDAHYTVFLGDVPSLKTKSFLEALEHFRSLDTRHKKKSDKKVKLKVVS
jgi:hypothetical protein